MTIILQLGKIRWDWTILDDEGEIVASGSSGDYLEACKAAHLRFDAIRGEIL